VIAPRRAACFVGIAAATLACDRSEKQEDRSAPSPPPVASPAPPELLHVPDPKDLLPPPVGEGLLPNAPRKPAGRCPPEMVDVRGEFCIDRYEIHLVDERTGEALSPYYHPTPKQTRASLARYREIGLGPGFPELPEPPAFQLAGEAVPSARSARGVVPSGYLSGVKAGAACRAAGKRLCTRAEWVLACRGQAGRKFPYGDAYEHGTCNVFRSSHPAQVLHGNASRHHLDPRLNRVADAEGPLLRRTGSLPRCRSEWGDDAIYDMVGNLDEWVDDGSFLGGFYSRGTREGCDARVSSHPPRYFDYSLGTRCCL